MRRRHGTCGRRFDRTTQGDPHGPIPPRRADRRCNCHANGRTRRCLPDNDQTLHFELTCDDDNVYQASFNGGPAAFHLDTGGLYIWKQIWFVTPDGASGTLTRGSQGFAAEPMVTCTYIGAVSGNDYTVIGFYPEK